MTMKRALGPKIGAAGDSDSGMGGGNCGGRCGDDGDCDGETTVPWMRAGSRTARQYGRRGRSCSSMSGTGTRPERDPF